MGHACFQPIDGATMRQVKQTDFHEVQVSEAQSSQAMAKFDMLRSYFYTTVCRCRKQRTAQGLRSEQPDVG